MANTETVEVRFMHECMRLMTYVNQANELGMIDESNFVTTWDAWSKVMSTYKVCTEIYASAFIKEKAALDAANDNVA